MTKYIQLLKQQRTFLVSRAHCATHFDTVMKRLSANSALGKRLSNAHEARAKVDQLDKKIHQESQRFGDLRFTVMGNWGR